MSGLLLALENMVCAFRESVKRLEKQDNSVTPSDQKTCDDCKHGIFRYSCNISGTTIHRKKAACSIFDQNQDDSDHSSYIP